MLNILIVDDDDGDRRLLRRALNQAGLSYNCVEAVSVEKAVEACGQRPFDCAIVDYRMPLCNGLEGIAALHRLHPHMPIIMGTGQGDEMIATEAMKRGATDYIPKGSINSDSIRRGIENAMEKAALRRKLAQQQAELENFARVLVHDLKAPITAIQSFAVFAEKSIADGKSELGTAHCRRVVKAAQRMNALIDTLHQYTKADAQIALEPVDMSRVLQDTLANLRAIIEEHGAQVTHDPLPVVIGHAPQLVQLLQNLIGNGIKYCEAEHPAVHIAALGQEGGWLFSVKDNGIGISEQYYQVVFEPFKRLDDAGKYEGSGLGLATCKKIVERHGGTIRCESVLGKGSTFLFTLPGADRRYGPGIDGSGTVVRVDERLWACAAAAAIFGQSISGVNIVARCAPQT